jgi:hypothetical protein
MVIVKTVEEFKKKNENELKAFMTHKTGIFDQETIKDTLQEFYIRLLQSKALEGFDENRAPTEEENKLNYEKWVCNNFCWLLPILRKKNYRGVLKIKMTKDEIECRDNAIEEDLEKLEKDSDYEVLRFYSTLNVKEGHTEIPKDIFEVISPSTKINGYTVDDRFRVSMVEQEEDLDAKKTLCSFFRNVRKTMPEKKAYQIESYMKYRLQGLNSVDIAILLGVSNNMVKFIKQEAKEKYEKWLKNRETL